MALGAMRPSTKMGYFMDRVGNFRAPSTKTGYFVDGQYGKEYNKQNRHPNRRQQMIYKERVWLISLFDFLARL